MKNLLPSLWNPNSLFGPSENPFRELNRMQRQMDRLFEGLMAPATSSRGVAATTEFAPSFDIKEAENHYLMSFDLPGVKKEDVKISLNDNVLTVTGERKDECEEKGKNHYHSERYYGSFTRSFTLPADVKSEQIEADFKDGVLRLAVPRGAAAKGQQIKIGEGKPGFFDRLLGHKKEEAKTQQQSQRPVEKVA